MNRLLIFALSAVLARTAAAEPAWFDTAVSNWKSDVRPASDFLQITFADENGVERTLYMDQTGLDLSVVEDPPKLVARPLFVFQTPPKKVEHSQLGSGGLTAFCDKNLVSAYYVKAHVMGGFTITRYDRPGTELFGTTDNTFYDWWEIDSGIFPPSKNYENAQKRKRGEPISEESCKRSENGITSCYDWDEEEAVKKRAIQAEKPTGVSPAADTPLTDTITGTYPHMGRWAVYGRQCFKLDDWWTKSPSDAETILLKAHTPIEHELLDMPIFEDDAKARALDGYRSSTISAMRGAKNYDGANEYLKKWRSRLSGAVQDEMDAATTKTLLTPFESRFLACRMAHAGGQAWLDEFRGKAEKAGSAGAEKFVEYWRAFVKAEMGQLLAEGAAAPQLEDYPDHAALVKALKERTKDALAGNFKIPKAAVAKKAPPPPPAVKIDQEQARAKTRRVKAKIEKMEDVLSQ